MTTSTQTQLRRGTNTQVLAMTPALAEPVVDTSNTRLYVGDGATAGGMPHATGADVQKQTFIYPTVGGTANAITLTHSLPWTSYANGRRSVFKATADSTSSVVINADGLGNRNAKFWLNGALTNMSATYQFKNGGIYELYDDGTQFQVQGLGVTTPASSGLVYLGVATASNSATIDLTSLMSSTYDDYLVILDSVVAATSSAQLYMRCSGDNSAFDAGSGAYFSSANGWDSSTGGGAALHATTGTFSTSALLTSALANTAGVSGQIMFNNVNLTSKLKFYTGTLSFLTSTSSVIGIMNVGGSWNNSSSALEAVRFYMSSGNITSGTFKMYGISKS